MNLKLRLLSTGIASLLVYLFQPRPFRSRACRGLRAPRRHSLQSLNGMSFQGSRTVMGYPQSPQSKY